MQEVRVINRNPVERVDSYNGITYTFKPNEKVMLPLAAAVHIFGYGLNADSPALAVVRRRISSNREEAQRFLENFTLETVDYVPADDAEELSNLKIVLEEKQALIEELQGKIDALTTEIQQLKGKQDKKKGKE